MGILQRIFGKVTGKRTLEANRPIRRWAEDRRDRFNPAENYALLNARAEAFSLNNPHGRRIVEVLKSNIVGTGIVPRPLITAKVMKDRIRTAWAVWVDGADQEELCDFYGLQQGVVSDLVVYGEHFSIIGADGLDGRPVLLRIHPDRIDRSMTQPLATGGYVIQGIEFNATGKRVAYHLRSGHAAEAAAGIFGTHPLRVPAAQIIHVFRPLVPGQVRGISWFASILVPSNELAKLLDATIVRESVAAMFVGSITDQDGNGPGMDGETSGTVLDTNAEPGSIRIEEPGKELRWNEPPDSGDVPQVAAEFLRMIATGAGVTYEALTSDYSKVNYSSARAAILEFRRFCEGVQHHTIAFQFNRPVWKFFIKWQVLKGTIAARDYVADRATFETAKWLPQAWAWVDPVKDVNAAVIALKHRLKSREAIVAEQGFDIEDLDGEISRDEFQKKVSDTEAARAV